MARGAQTGHEADRCGSVRTEKPMRRILFAGLLIASPAMAEDKLRDLCAERPGLDTPACTVDPGGLTTQFERDVLPPHVVVEVSNHVLPRWPATGGQRDPLSG